MAIKLSNELKAAVLEAAKRQHITPYIGWGNQPGKNTAMSVKLSVEVSLIKDCTTSYKYWTADGLKPAYIGKTDERFTFDVQGGVLEITGTLKDLFARKLLS